MVDNFLKKVWNRLIKSNLIIRALNHSSLCICRRFIFYCYFLFHELWTWYITLAHYLFSIIYAYARRYNILPFLDLFTQHIACKRKINGFCKKLKTKLLSALETKPHSRVKTIINIQPLSSRDCRLKYVSFSPITLFYWINNH